MTSKIINKKGLQKGCVPNSSQTKKGSKRDTSLTRIEFMSMRVGTSPIFNKYKKCMWAYWLWGFHPSNLMNVFFRKNG